MGKFFTRAILFSTILATISLSRIWAADGDAPPRTQAPKPHDPAFFDAMMARLQSAADSRRELDKTIVTDKPLLTNLMNKSTDPVIKKWIQERLLEIDIEAATNLTPLSIDVTDATLPDVADQLSTAMGMKIDTWPPRQNNARFNGNNSALYTLKMENKSFWDIYAALAQQHGLSIQAYDTFRLQAQEPGMHHFVPVGSGFVIFPMSINRNTVVDSQNSDPNQKPQSSLSFNYIIGADPRLKIVRYKQPTLTEIKDDKGNSLLMDNNWASDMQENGNNSSMFQQGIQLKNVDNIGSKIVSAKGKATFVIQTSEETLDVNPDEKLNQEIKLKDRSMTIKKFKINNNQIEFEIQSQYVNNNQGSPLHIAFIDADGKTVWKTPLNGGTSGSTGGNFKPPVKIRMAVASGTTTIEVPFELKDLPLP